MRKKKPKDPSKVSNFKSRNKSRNVKARPKAKQISDKNIDDLNSTKALEIDISKGISDLKVAYNPDFGYGEIFSPVEKEKPSPWKIIADAISEYPHFQISSKVIDQIK